MRKLIFSVASLLYLVFPTDLSSEPVGSPAESAISRRRLPLEAIISENADLRSLFTDRAELQDRINRGVIIFEGKWARIGKVVELKSSPNLTIADVLQQVGMSDWKGVPTIKLISKSIIAKNSGKSRDPEKPMNVDKFLQLEVSSGNVVVVSPMD